MRKKRKKDNQKIKIFIIIIFLVLITFIMLIAQIFELIGKRTNIKAENTVVQEVSEPKEEKKELEFDTFVDKKYTVSELENLNSETATELLNTQKSIIKQNKIDIKKIVGSAENLDEAKKIASDAFANENNFISSIKLLKEDELYYIITVKWRYVDENVTNSYEQNVLVFKKFYYNKNTNILNLDDTDKIKRILDIDYYISNYNNSSMCMIQSFINKEGKTCEYVLYYFDITYDNERQKDRMDLVKETVFIDPATGEITSKTEDIIKRNLTIQERS